MKKLLAFSTLISGIALADTSPDYWIVSETSSSPTTVLIEQSSVKAKSGAPAEAIARATPRGDNAHIGRYVDIYSDHVTKVKNNTSQIQYYNFKYKHDIDILKHHEKIERRVGIKPGGVYIKNDVVRSSTGSNSPGFYKFFASTRIEGESTSYGEDWATLNLR